MPRILERMHRRGDVIFGFVWLAIGVALGLAWIEVSRPLPPGPVPQDTAAEGLLGFSLILGLIMASIVWLMGFVIFVGALITQRRRR